MKNVRLWLCLCFFAQSGFAQTGTVDSLKRELIKAENLPNGYARDTSIYRNLKELMSSYSDLNIDSSFYYQGQILKHCRERGLKKELTFVYYYTGLLYQIKSEFYKSIRFYLNALSLAEKESQYELMIAACGGLAHTYTRLNRNLDALVNCEKGLALLDKYTVTGAYDKRLALLNVQGVIFRKMGKFSEALQADYKMYNLARTKPFDAWYEAHGLHAVGLVYKELGDIPKALELHQKALGLSLRANSVELEGNILVNIADLYIRQKKWRDALPYLDQAEEMAFRVKNSGILSESYEKRYLVYSNINEPKKALAAFEQFVSLRDSLLKDSNQQRIADLQDKYLNEKKTIILQQQVALLNEKSKNQELSEGRNRLLVGILVILLVVVLTLWNNRRLQIKNRELLRKNEEIKAALFKGQTIERKRVALELHDNLSSLLSAVNMSVQSMNPANLSEREQAAYGNVKHLIQNAYAEVRNISHNILPAELEKDGLSIALQSLVDRLNENLPIRFSLIMGGLTDRLPVEIEYNVYSIVFELLNNAIKHAKATEVIINLSRTPAGINLSVMDDGVGLGAHNSKHGVGLENINSRLESLGGTLQTIQPEKKGTRFYIEIPIETVGLDGNDVHI